MSSGGGVRDGGEGPPGGFCLKKAPRWKPFIRDLTTSAAAVLLAERLGGQALLPLLRPAAAAGPIIGGGDELVLFDVLDELLAATSERPGMSYS